MSIECPSTGVLHTPVSLVDYIFAYDDLPFTTSEGGAGMKNMLAVLGASENQVLSYTDDSYNWLSWGVNFTSTSLSDHAGKIVVIQYCHYLFIPCILRSIVSLLKIPSMFLSTARTVRLHHPYSAPPAKASSGQRTATVGSGGGGVAVHMLLLWLWTRCQR